jgi:hypothetical protein
MNGAVSDNGTPSTTSLMSPSRPSGCCSARSSYAAGSSVYHSGRHRVDPESHGVRTRSPATVGATWPPLVSAVSAAGTRHSGRAARSDLAPERTRRSDAIPAKRVPQARSGVSRTDHATFGLQPCRVLLCRGAACGSWTRGHSWAALIVSDRCSFAQLRYRDARSRDDAHAPRSWRARFSRATTRPRTAIRAASEGRPDPGGAGGGVSPGGPASGACRRRRP